MPAKLLDILSIIILLVCGTGSYIVLAGFTNLSFGIDVVIAACSRILSLLFYRHYASQIRENPSRTWLAFEWLIPGVLMIELFLVACGYSASDGLGKSLITNF
jgi:hypothetical protein